MLWILNRPFGASISKEALLLVQKRHLETGNPCVDIRSKKAHSWKTGGPEQNRPTSCWAQTLCFFFWFWSFGFLNTWIPNFYLLTPSQFSCKGRLLAALVQPSQLAGFEVLTANWEVILLTGFPRGKLDGVWQSSGFLLLKKGDMEMHFLSLENGMIDPVDPSHLILFKHLFYLYILYYSVCIADILWIFGLPILPLHLIHPMNLYEIVHLCHQKHPCLLWNLFSRQVMNDKLAQMCIRCGDVLCGMLHFL